MTERYRNIVFYDGYCPLCHGLVRCLIHMDKKRTLFFASLQSELAARSLPDLQDPKASVTLVFSSEGNVFVRSEAIFEIMSFLPYWRHFRFLRLIPRWFSDSVYDLIARLRTPVFGKYDSCPVPDLSIRDRFLD